MQSFKLDPCVRMVRTALVPVACLSLLTACATYESQPASVAASSSLPSPATLQNYRAVRASDLIGKAVRNQSGEYLGQVADLIVQMGTGEVRYAVVSSAGAGGRWYALPVHGIKPGADHEIVMDLAQPRLADHRSWTRWPDMNDIAFWSELDRVSGFPAVQPGHGYDRLSELRGKLVVGANGEHLGRVENLVINEGTDAVHYAIVELQPGPPGGGRLVAVPLHGFSFPREGTNRLALRIDASRLAQLETFDAARWQALSDPGYVAHIDRYFVTAFPATSVSLFEQLDTNRDGFLSRAELAPLQMAGSDRYALYGGSGTSAIFQSLDRDGDGFLTRTEAEPALRGSGRTFARLDTNGDGFLSMAEAGPMLGSMPAGERVGTSFEQLDRDRDGFVNRAEADALMPRMAGAVRERVVVRPAVTFDSLDVDRDGFLSRAESATLLNRSGGTAAFDRYDTNRDGFLSRAELDVMLQQQSVGGTAGQPASSSIANPPLR